MSVMRGFRWFSFFIIRFVAPIAVLGLAAMMAKQMMEGKEEAERFTPPDRGTLVEVVEVSPARHQVTVQANGEVIPARELVLQSQATGRVDTHSANLILGGIVAEGEELVRLERRQYRLALDMREAELEQAEAQVDLEEGRARIAEREFELFESQFGDSSGDSRSLALREPQMRSAQVAVEAAEVRVSLARLDYNRTTVDAPFSAYVRSESVEVGQLVTPATPLASLVGTDAFWVEATVPVGELRHIHAPRPGSLDSGSLTRVWQEFDGERVEWEGHVVRVLNELDPVGRMARVLVEVEDPLGLHGAPEDFQILMIGAFVYIEITGREPLEVFEVPRVAVRGGDSVYVMTADDLLTIRPIEITRGTRDLVLVSSGLEPGDRVITSRIGVPVEGMLLRLEGQDEGSGRPGGPGRRPGGRPPTAGGPETSGPPQSGEPGVTPAPTAQRSTPEGRPGPEATMEVVEDSDEAVRE